MTASHSSLSYNSNLYNDSILISVGSSNTIARNTHLMDACKTFGQQPVISPINKVDLETGYILNTLIVLVSALECYISHHNHLLTKKTKAFSGFLN